MLGRSYHKIRETAFDLYNESERLPWYFKALSVFSSWLVLAGYVLFSIAYTSSQNELRISSSFMTGLAASGVFLGYLSDAALAFLSRSLIFTFDGVLMPVLTASAVGLFSTAVHRALKKTSEPGNEIYLLLPLGVSAFATLVSSVLSFIVYRKLRNIKQLDARRRAHVAIDHFTPTLPHNVSREVRNMVPDDEAQRRQLMALLMAKADRQPSIEDTSSTFRIDFPGEDSTGRQRSGSLPPNPSSGGRFTISNLVGRNRSGTTDSFKDPRERRREQIEQGSLMTVYGQPNSAGLSPGWQNSQYSPPLTGYSQRYG